LKERYADAYRTDARASLSNLNIGLGQSFDSLSQSQIAGLQAVADARRYQQSLALFYARLQRRAR
jgi:hypothetical protein